MATFCLRQFNNGSHSLSVTDSTDSSDECGTDPAPKEKTAFFLWRGRHSSVSGRDTAAFLSIGMRNHEESQVRLDHLLI